MSIFNNNESNEKRWLTTNEIANALGVSRKTVLGFYYTNKQLFEGHTSVSSGETLKGAQTMRLWDFEAQKILALGIQNKPVEEWKENITNEVIEKGIVITSDAKPREMVRMVLQQMINVIDMQEALEERVERLEFKDQFIFVTPRTKKRCRDNVRRVVEEYNLSWQDVWIPKKNRYQFNNYDDMTEEVAQKIIKELDQEYPPKSQQKSLPHF